MPKKRSATKSKSSYDEKQRNQDSNSARYEEDNSKRPKRSTSNDTTVMSLRGEIGWQTEKTLAECMRYTLENEIATDVIFEVGPPDGVTINIHAHKWMLKSRSAVFEAMFASGMVECRGGPHARIRVEDIDAAIFKDLLLYFYCEVVSVSVETAGALMYAANKYLLPKLARECGKCLAEGLSVDNVIYVLEQSLLFDDSELESNCRELIVKNANAVFTGKEINSASPQTLETLLNMDKLHVKEVVIYKTCIAWAEQQLLIQRSAENPTDQKIREILGSLLYKIRFPTMRTIEFAEISEGKNVLTGEEKASIYYYLATKKKGSQLMFPTKRRLSKEVWIERSETCINQPLRNPKGASNFTTDQDILLAGIGLYTGHNGAGFDVVIEIKQSDNSLLKKTFTVPSTGDENQFKVLMNEMIFIKAGVVYTIKASAKAIIGHYSPTCQAVCTKGDVTFTFSAAYQSLYPVSNPTYCPTIIPRLYFCF